MRHPALFAGPFQKLPFARPFKFVQFHLVAFPAFNKVLQFFLDPVHLHPYIIL